MAQTSDRVSSIAARYANITEEGLLRKLDADPRGTLNDIRALAASALRQDETKGSRFMKLIGLGSKSA